MTIWILILIYLLVGCIRTATIIADQTLSQEELQPINVSALEIGFGVLFWGVNVITVWIADLIVTFVVRKYGDGDE